VREIVLQVREYSTGERESVLQVREIVLQVKEYSTGERESVLQVRGCSTGEKVLYR